MLAFPEMRYRSEQSAAAIWPSSIFTLRRSPFERQSGVLGSENSGPRIAEKLRAITRNASD